MTQPSLGPVKVGVVGLGRFGRLHALTLDGLAETELTAVVARRQASLDAFAGELPDVPGFLDLEQACDTCDTDAWVVACTTASHVPITRTLLDRGKTVLLEKPIADNLDEAESLSSQVAEDSSNLMIGHIVLFNSEFQELRSAVQQRGPIEYIDCVRHRPATIVRDFPGENPLHAAMVHDLYCAHVLLDGEEPEHYSAQYHRNRDGAINLALAQLRWPSGPVASFTASYLTPEGMAPRGFDRLELFGQGWSARMEPNPRPLEIWDSRAHWPYALEVRATPPGGMMAEELRHLARVVRGQATPPAGASYRDALQVQRWMETLDSVAK